MTVNTKNNPKKVEPKMMGEKFFHNSP